MVYTNTTSDKVLNETLGLQLDGLRIDGQDDQSEVKVLVNPGDLFVVSLVKTGGGYGYGTSFSYLIEDYTGPPIAPKTDGKIINFYPD